MVVPVYFQLDNKYIVIKGVLALDIDRSLHIVCRFYFTV
jgi:hypothetical protein